jgi:hypothetical protein
MFRNNIARRSTSPIKSAALSTAESKQERGTGTGKKTVTVPSTASNQPRVTVRGQLKNPLNSYSSGLLPAVSNPGKC